MRSKQDMLEVLMEVAQQVRVDHVKKVKETFVNGGYSAALQNLLFPPVGTLEALEKLSSFIQSCSEEEIQKPYLTGKWDDTSAIIHKYRKQHDS